MKIAILSPREFDHAETFIKNHITNLPFEKIVIFGGEFPYLSDIYPLSFNQQRFFHLKNKLRRKLGIKTRSIQEHNLAKILTEEEIDFVVAEFLVTGANACKICKELGIPLIALSLGFEISMFETVRKYENRYRELFQYAKNIIVVSKHMEENLLKLDCPANKIVYSPLGPKEDFFLIKPEFKKPQILAIGRFVEKKAPYLTILAFKKVLDEVPEAMLIMAGDGDLLHVCKDLALVLKIQDSIIFKGRINEVEQKELLESSYMFVQHSKIASDGDSEGTPVAILEASASGLPVVSTFHAGIPDVIMNHETGFLIKEYDIDEMSNKMIFLLNNKDLAIKMGLKGKDFVQANFSMNMNIKTISDLIYAS